MPFSHITLRCRQRVLSYCLTRRLCACCSQVPFNDTAAFALIKRGPRAPDNCSFGLKVFHAQTAGFAGAIIYDYDEDDNLVHMDYTGPLNINISSVFVSLKDGDYIKQLIEDGDIDGISTWATMFPDGPPQPFLFTFVTIVAGISIVFTLFLVSWRPISSASISLSLVANVTQTFTAQSCTLSSFSTQCFLWLPQRQDTLSIFLCSNDVFPQSGHCRSRFRYPPPPPPFFSSSRLTHLAASVVFSFIDDTRRSCIRDQRCGCRPHRLSSWPNGLLSRATKTKHAASA